MTGNYRSKDRGLIETGFGLVGKNEEARVDEFTAGEQSGEVGVATEEE